MRKLRNRVLAVCVLMTAVGVAQTPSGKQKAGDKKSAGAGRNMPVMPGSEQWTDVPAAALVGTPAVEMGGTIKLAVLQGDPMTPGHSYTL